MDDQVQPCFLLLFVVVFIVFIVVSVSVRVRTDVSGDKIQRLYPVEAGGEDNRGVRKRGGGVKLRLDFS